MTTTSTTPALSPALTAALYDAWRRAGGEVSALDAAITALPPTVGRRGWPLRWALAARVTLAAAARAARAGRAERANAAYRAERAAEAAAPVWGVVKEYGVGHWSHCYSYSVGFGAGKMSRAEAEEAAEAAFKGDKVAQDHRRAWLDFMMA